jgi:predicted component of type VI protein secretion system
MNYKFRHLESGVPYLVKPGKNVIGRSSEADIQVDHESISRRHAQLENSGTILFVRDLGSTNGTFVSDQAVNTPTMVELGTIVQIGEVQFRIDPESGGSEPPPPVVSWESYQRKTNKVPKTAQLPIPSLQSQQEFSHNPAPEGPKWGPAVTLPLQREGALPAATASAPVKIQPFQASSQQFGAAPVPWKLMMGLTFGAGIAVGLFIGLILARFLFIH